MDLFRKRVSRKKGAPSIVVGFGSHVKTGRVQGRRQGWKIQHDRVGPASTKNTTIVLVGLAYVSVPSQEQTECFFSRRVRAVR